MTHRDSVLVGVDGSRAGSAAIRYGAHEAQRLGTGIRLVHMVPNYLPITPMYPLAPRTWETPDATSCAMRRSKRTGSWSQPA